MLRQKKFSCSLKSRGLGAKGLGGLSTKKNLFLRHSFIAPCCKIKSAEKNKPEKFNNLDIICEIKIENLRNKTNLGMCSPVRH